MKIMQEKNKKILRLLPFALLFLGLVYFNVKTNSKDNHLVSLTMGELNANAQVEPESCEEKCDSKMDENVERSNERARDAMWDASFGHLEDTVVPELIIDQLPGVSDSMNFGPVAEWFEHMIGVYSYVFENLTYIWGATAYIDDIRENELNEILDLASICRDAC